MSSEAEQDPAFGPDAAAAAMNLLEQAVVQFDADGRVSAGNASWRRLPAEVHAQVLVAVRNWLRDAAEGGGAAGAGAPVRLSRRIEAEAGRYMLAATFAPGVDRAVAAVTLVCEVTADSRLQEQLNAIDAAGRELVNLDANDSSRLSVPERLKLLEEKIIRYCHDLMHFSHFAVRIMDPKSGRLDTVLAGGFPEEARSLEILARPEGHGISGYVAATGQAVICPDVSADPRYLPGIEGARSSLTIPLRLHDEVIGILNVESEQLRAFTEEDRQVAEIFGRYIAAALHVLKLLVVERAQTTDQLASDLANELVEPLDRILSDAAIIAEQTSDLSEVRVRALDIVTQVDLAKRALHDVLHPPPIKGLAGGPTEYDPLLEGRSVLIADDEAIIRDTIAAVLGQAGALTTTASDGNDALRLLRTQPFDLVLSDIKMPNRNGYEVFAAAKAANPQTPVILITGFGYDPEHQVVRASKEGLAGVLFKPFEVAQLMKVVHEALAGQG